MAIKIASKVKSAIGVTFAFVDKANTKLECNLTELSPEMVQTLAIHGLTQKVGDSYSSVETAGEGLESAKRVWESLKQGIFNARGVGVSSILAEAIARIKNITVDEATAALGQMEEDNLDKLKANPKVKAMITVIRGERAAAKTFEGDDELDLSPKKAKGTK